jgi:ApbE superfamily uncharacterized protein (UPF0280 family)
MDIEKKLYTDRFYRKDIKPDDLYCYEVKDKESDLLISSEKYLKDFAKENLKKYRNQIEEYIKKDPYFIHALKPYKLLKDAPLIVRKMHAAGKICGVGPMASVAGAISQFLGKDLLRMTDEVIIENGGDIFIKTKKIRRLAIFSGNTEWKDKLVLIIKPEQTPLGICTSSGKIGHSLSFGNADAVVIISKSAILADAVATAAGNMIKSCKDIPKTIKYCKGISKVKGTVIIKDKHMGIWGDIQLEETEN